MTTALDWAVKHGNLEMAEMVAKAGVDVNAKSHEFLFLPPEVCTVFHRAAVHSKKLIIHSLISTYRKSEKTSEMETETNDSSLEVTSDTGEAPLCCTGVQQEEKQMKAALYQIRRDTVWYPDPPNIPLHSLGGVPGYLSLNVDGSSY
ncbi:hypothetical protein DV515_00008246 [Chloebia gouldiae]|uniref:Uncharacterized protein n=1 Tax=Chloebia gouldiae TaxID=44316 RepID=A0A3L8SF88_CHLGU|nr:hypothetical protein DV515_00008246 [Chloebia gouldiae]